MLRSAENVEDETKAVTDGGFDCRLSYAIHHLHATTFSPKLNHSCQLIKSQFLSISELINVASFMPTVNNSSYIPEKEASLWFLNVSIQ